MFRPVGFWWSTEAPKQSSPTTPSSLLVARAARKGSQCCQPYAWSVRRPVRNEQNVKKHHKQRLHKDKVTLTVHPQTCCHPICLSVTTRLTWVKVWTFNVLALASTRQYYVYWPYTSHICLDWSLRVGVQWTFELNGYTAAKLDHQVLVLEMLQIAEQKTEPKDHSRKRINGSQNHCLKLKLWVGFNRYIYNIIIVLITSNY